MVLKDLLLSIFTTCIAFWWIHIQIKYIYIYKMDCDYSQTFPLLCFVSPFLSIWTPSFYHVLQQTHHRSKWHSFLQQPLLAYSSLKMYGTAWYLFYSCWMSQSCAGSYCWYVFMIVKAMTCLDGKISWHSSPTSGSYILSSCPPTMMLSGLWRLI